MSRFASLSSIGVLLCFTAILSPHQVTAQSSPTATGALCNTDGTSANIAFSTTSSKRVITTNMCPNHAVRTINPNAARQNSFFGVSNQQYSVPLKPQLASTANIINVTCIPGPIGFTRSGAVIFSVYAATYCGDDAVKLESKTFDECNGHSEQSGMYHYHMTPGCTLLTSGYVSTAHSPILGYMLDGIPIYGPLSDKGALPTDLDSCGGHSSDSGNNGQYHYHMKPVTGSWPDPSTPTTSTTNIGAGWPYTPGCLRGCVDSPYLNFFSGQGATKYTTYAACTSTGGAILSNVETITSATATPSPPTPTTTTAAPAAPPATTTTSAPTTAAPVGATTTTTSAPTVATTAAPAAGATTTTTAATGGTTSAATPAPVTTKSPGSTPKTPAPFTIPSNLTSYFSSAPTLQFVSVISLLVSTVLLIAL